MNKQHDVFQNFSMNEFKKWMNNQTERSSRKSKGRKIVECKVSLQKLISEIDVEDGDIEKIAKDFKKNGGSVIETDETLALIECDQGTFYIPKSYIRKV